MPTHPQTSSHLNNFTRADGTTVQHDEDHGRVIDIHVNAKRYLKGNGTVESSTDIDAFAAACSGGIGFFPAGTYIWPTGYSLTMSANTTYRGVGNATIIQYKNAYAFKTPATGSLDGVTVEKMKISAQGGATSGGGVYCLSNSYHAAWTIQDAAMIGTGTDPAMLLDGVIGGWIDRCNFSAGNADCVHMQGVGFVSQYVAITKTRFGPQTYSAAFNAGLYLDGVGQARLADLDFENCNVGLRLRAGGGVLHNCRFEANKNHNIYSYDGGLVAELCYFYYHDVGGGAGTYNAAAVHAYFDSALVTDVGNIVPNSFIACQFQDAPLGPNKVYINNQYLHGWTFMRNGVLLRSDIGGVGTRIFFLGDTGYAAEWAIPGLGPELHVRTSRTAAAVGGDINSAENVFSVVNAVGDNWIMMGSRGYLQFHTAATLTSSDELQTNSFAFFWDEAAGKIKARVRNNAGTYSTLDVTP